MIHRDQLVAACDHQLRAAEFKDFTINGLQIAGHEQVKRIMTGVTACQALLDEAVAWQADMVLVHHGYFWKNEPVAITGMKQRRLKRCLIMILACWRITCPWMRMQRWGITRNWPDALAGK